MSTPSVPDSQLHELSLVPSLVRTNIELELMLHDARLLRYADLNRSVIGINAHSTVCPY